MVQNNLVCFCLPINVVSSTILLNRFYLKEALKNISEKRHVKNKVLSLSNKVILKLKLKFCL